MIKEQTYCDLVLAVDERGALGKQGALPWRQSRDLKRFRELTVGSPVVMGRKTFDSVGRVLPGRLNLVVSRERPPTPLTTAVELQNWNLSMPLFVGDGDQALMKAWEWLASPGRKALEPRPVPFLIGGGVLVRELWPRVRRFYLTRIHTVVEGADAHLEGFAPDQWTRVSQEHFPADETNQFPYTFEIYDRC